MRPFGRGLGPTAVHSKTASSVLIARLDSKPRIMSSAVMTASNALTASDRAALFGRLRLGLGQWFDNLAATGSDLGYRGNWTGLLPTSKLRRSSVAQLAEPSERVKITLKQARAAIEGERRHR